MQIQGEITNFLKNNGVSDVGFAHIPDGSFGEKTFAISIVVRLSDAVVDEITDEPTHTYFSHYRAVNAFIDRMLLQTGLLLQKYGYKYIPVAASQSINKDGWNFEGRYSHKKAASLAGLGGIGKNNLFLHNDYGCRVRLGTVFTDCHFDIENKKYSSPCIECDLCVKACPSGAIKDKLWSECMNRYEVFDPEKCSCYMKENFKDIGRGAVCGICMKVCPIGVKKESFNGTEKN